ncbi:AI-2E family transporter [Candidatus Woesearchaeota archaeon]|nr:AI-2E family transporter [Candidatus Woesearchaeota archaeon]
MVIKKSDRANILLVALIALLAYLSFQIVRPFINTILGAFIIAFLFYPLYSRIAKRTSPSASAFIVSAILLLLIITPTYFAVNAISSEASYLYLRTKQISATGSFFTVQCTSNDFFCLASRGIDKIVEDPQLNLYFRSVIGKITDYIINSATDFVLLLPNFLMHMFIIFFILYYAFKESDNFIGSFKNLFPGSSSVSEVVITQLRNVVNAVILGSLIIAFLQGVAAAIGFLLFGIASPFLWAVLIACIALIPMIGATVIWAPLGTFYLLSGIVSNSNWGVIQGVFVLTYGFFVISGIENVLKPKIISKWGNVHPVIVILGAIGGVTIFGITGFIIGPLVLATVKTLLEEPKVRVIFGV